MCSFFVILIILTAITRGSTHIISNSNNPSIWYGTFIATQHATDHPHIINITITITPNIVNAAVG